MQAEVADWPKCDYLIAFDANGFPLEKVIAYKLLVQPKVLNEIEPQMVLRDRRDIIHELKKCQVPIPPSLIVSRERRRSGEFSPEELVEDENSVSAGGITIKKPFVEKPVRFSSCRQLRKSYRVTGVKWPKLWMPSQFLTR